MAVFLSAAMLLTSAGLSSLPGGMITAQAADAGSYEASSYVTNGDFETGDASGWTVNSELVANTNYQVKADSYDSTNQSNAFAFLDATAQGTAISIFQ